MARGNQKKKRETNLARRSKPDWAKRIWALRNHLSVNQTDLGSRLGFSAMALSRRESGMQEPSAQGYIGLGNLAGDPECWYFWARAGFQSEMLVRIPPHFKKLLGRQPS